MEMITVEGVYDYLMYVGKFSWSMEVALDVLYWSSSCAMGFFEVRESSSPVPPHVEVSLTLNAKTSYIATRQVLAV